MREQIRKDSRDSQTNSNLRVAHFSCINRREKCAEQQADRRNGRVTQRHSSQTHVICDEQMRFLLHVLLWLALASLASASWWWPEGPSYFECPDVKEFITPADVERAMKDHSPLLVQFFAPWCSHCTGFRPVFKQVGKELHSKVSTFFFRSQFILSADFRRFAWPESIARLMQTRSFAKESIKFKGIPRFDFSGSALWRSSSFFFN